MIALQTTRLAVVGLALLAALAACDGRPERMKGPAVSPAADSVPVVSGASPGEATPAAPADSAPAGAADGVTVAGTVVAGESGEPVPAAYVVVLKPGIRFEEWEAAAGEETGSMIQAAVRADSTGAWRVPRLPRGGDYTVMIGARGYRSAAFDLGLTVEADAPEVKTLEPVALEPAVW